VSSMLPSVEESLRTQQVDPARGLSQAEVQARRAQHGYNEVPEVKTSALRMFLKKFWGLSAWMLELIIVLSWVLHRRSDVYVVSLLLVVNAVLSFLEERRASRTIDELRQELQIGARVLREGQWSVVQARELVPGDIVRLRPGDLVPADAQLLRGSLSVDQSALTGESLQVDKERSDPLYSGAVVRRGEATALVLLTGAHTYFGKTAQLVQIARPRLEIERVVSNVVRWLFFVVGVLVAVSLAFAWRRGIPLLDMLPLMLVLLLGAIPVALPVMFTVSMAVGSRELAHKGVLVTRLSASEDAAGMDVLCVDKTGTITQNRLSVTQVLPQPGSTEEEVLLYGALASQEANQDPIDLAFLRAARERKLLDDSTKRLKFVPFDPATRCTEAVLQRDGQEQYAIKGAAETLIAASGLDAAGAQSVNAQVQALALRGYRTLAVGVRDGAGDPAHVATAAGSGPGASDQAGQACASFRLLGLVALLDPPRSDSAELIQQLKALGISVKMLTGDALPIALETAQTVGLGANITRAAELQELLKQDPARAGALAERSDGFAEVYPEDKYSVVKALQACGHVVGMTGDGVNDAPALKQAEVGIAVSSATDMAKQSASVVLASEGLIGIVDLVTNGRKIYQRIVTWVINKISRTILKAGLVVLAFIASGRDIISASAILTVTLMTDFMKISLSTDNVRWSRRPETWNVLALVKVAALLGVLMVAEALGMLWIGVRYLGLSDDPHLYTLAFEILLYFAAFSILVVRERGHFWSSRPSRTLLLAIALDLVVGTLIASIGLPHLKPLPWVVTASVLAWAAFFSLGVNDWIKWLAVEKLGLLRW